VRDICTYDIHCLHLSHCLFQMTLSPYNRGFLGKVLAAKFCRENSVPYLGICLGFQAMVVEYSRNMLNWEDANSTEFDDQTKNPVVIFMPEIDKENMGGTMRLGSRNTAFTHPTHEDGSPSIAQIMYQKCICGV